MTGYRAPLTLRSTFEASADTAKALTRRSFSVGGDAQGEALFLSRSRPFVLKFPQNSLLSDVRIEISPAIIGFPVFPPPFFTKFPEKFPEAGNFGKREGRLDHMVYGIADHTNFLQNSLLFSLHQGKLGDAPELLPDHTVYKRSLVLKIPSEFPAP
ncbi:MAG TPA: hypothetical protein VHT03_15375 [Rhizomicrobium sp.]|jgi:hypothetical protein|nr:hypothetical protein [Rhizomicrobium sp.]